MTHTTKALSYDFRVRAFWVLSILCVMSLGVYIYSVNMTIRNTAMRQSLETQVAELAVDQSELEFAYIEKTQAITIDLAYQSGFQDVKNPLYVSRTPGSALTFNR